MNGALSLKKKNLLFISGVFILYLCLYWTGTFAATPTGYTGIGKEPALSPNDEELTFTYFQNDHGALYSAPIEGGMAKPLLEPEEGKDDLQPAYSPDGESMLFLREWEGEEHMHKQLMLYKDGGLRPLLGEEEYVPYAAFAPDGEHVYFVKNSKYTETYNNRTQPNGFDIYKMNLNTEEIEQITNMNTVSISSLQIIEGGKKLMYSKSYETSSIKILDLESGKTKTILPVSSDYSKAQSPTLSSPTRSPEGKVIAFADVASKSSNGTFQYEIFTMDTKGENIKQITNFSDYAGHPRFFQHSNHLLVTVDRNFAGREPDYEYWVVERDGSNRKEIHINIPEKETEPPS